MVAVATLKIYNMVTGVKMRDNVTPEVNYRALPALNNSSIKDFYLKGLGVFYNQFVLGKPAKDKEDLEENGSIITGLVFDFIMTDCDGSMEEFEQRYDEKFTLFQGIKSETQEFLLADELFRVVKENMDEDGIIREEFRVMFEQALSTLQNQKDKKFKGKSVEWAMQAFIKQPDEEKLRINPNLTSAHDYFQAKMQNVGKQTVDMWQIDVAKRLYTQAMTDEWVRGIFHPEEGIEVVNKMILEWEQETAYGILKCKAELDKTLWNHKKKWVAIKDVKTIYDNRTERVLARYRKSLYGWQGAFYCMGMEKYLKDKGMEDYMILPFEFIFFSTGNTNRPVRLEMNDDMMNAALGGYNDGYTWNKGLLTTLENIAWHEHTGNYSTEKDIFMNHGKITY
jgi:hypothetical protein